MIAADQEPGDPGAEAASAQAPFIEIVEVATFPMRGDETQNRDKEEKADEDAGGHPIQMIDHRFSPL